MKNRTEMTKKIINFLKESISDVFRQIFISIIIGAIFFFIVYAVSEIFRN